MKILYICSLFCQKNSSAAIRNMSLVDGLVKNGHQVKVVTLAVNSEEENKLYKEIDCQINLLGSASKSLSPTNKLGGFTSSKLFSKLFNFIRPILFFPDTHNRFIKLIQDEELGQFDVIISSSDTKSSHFAALKVKEKFPFKKWVQIWGDPWVADVTLDRLSKFRIKGKEEFLLNKADQVVYISKITMDFMKGLYPKFKNKINYVPRSYYKKIINPLVKTKNLRFLYTGVISHGRNIEAVFEWFEESFALNSSALDIYGYVSDEMKLDFSRYKKVNFQGILNYEDILKEYETTDVLLLLGNKIGSTQIPGKLYDYLGTNLPILCVMHSHDEPVSILLKSFKQCIVLTYKDLKDKNINLEELNVRLTKRFIPVEDFSSSNVSNRLIELIDND